MRVLRQDCDRSASQPSSTRRHYVPPFGSGATSSTRTICPTLAPQEPGIGASVIGLETPGIGRRRQCQDRVIPGRRQLQARCTEQPSIVCGNRAASRRLMAALGPGTKPSGYLFDLPECRGGRTRELAHAPLARKIPGWTACAITARAAVAAGYRPASDCLR